MSRARRWALAALAGLWLVSAVPSGARAQSESGASPEPERAIGVIGAAICGAEGWLLRTQPEIGMNPYVLAAGIGGCLLLLLDVCTT